MNPSVKKIVYVLAHQDALRPLMVMYSLYVDLVREKGVPHGQRLMNAMLDAEVMVNALTLNNLPLIYSMTLNYD